MADANDRLQDALAAYLDHLEMGGPEPDTSHLSAAEKEKLKELVEALELTEGVALGRGMDEAAVSQHATPETAEGERLVRELRTALPPSVRIESDTNSLITHIGGVAILDRLILGTFGGRVRAWILDEAGAQAIEHNADCLTDLNRVFRMFPDTAAVALVGKDLSCLIVEPEDCAPQIQVPSGSFVGRRYRRSIQPAAEALPTFLDELVPYWDPMPAFDRDSGLRIDVGEIGDDFVRVAVERQRGIGERARKGNPKKDALLAFGKKEITAITALAGGLFDGSIEPDEVEQRIERLAGGP